MRSNRKIAVLLSDTLLHLGLQTLFDNYFPELEIYFFSTFKELPQKQQKELFTLYLIDIDSFVLNLDYFLPRRNRIIIFHTNKDVLPVSSVNMISTKSSLEQIIASLERQLMLDDSINSPMDSGKGLSDREINVLRQIVKGFTNKEIADHLNISLNTVLSHRKNITTKLGIKTVSGLTFYAMMNGIVTVDEINI